MEILGDIEIQHETLDTLAGTGRGETHDHPQASCPI
jgi:hypothetical protein